MDCSTTDDPPPAASLNENLASASSLSKGDPWQDDLVARHHALCGDARRFLADRWLELEPSTRTWLINTKVYSLQGSRLDEVATGLDSVDTLELCLGILLRANTPPMTEQTYRTALEDVRKFPDFETIDQAAAQIATHKAWCDPILLKVAIRGVIGSRLVDYRDGVRHPAKSQGNSLAYRTVLAGSIFALPLAVAGTLISAFRGNLGAATLWAYLAAWGAGCLYTLRAGDIAGPAAHQAEIWWRLWNAAQAEMTGAGLLMKLEEHIKQGGVVPLVLYDLLDMLRARSKQSL